MKKFVHSFLLGWVGCHWFRFDKKSKLRIHQLSDIVLRFCSWFFFLGFICVSSGILVLDPVSDDLVPFFDKFVHIVFLFVCLSFVDSFIYLCLEDKDFVKVIKAEIREKDKNDERIDCNYDC